jgi:hypothetical protein
MSLERKIPRLIFSQVCFVHKRGYGLQLEVSPQLEVVPQFEVDPQIEVSPQLGVGLQKEFENQK